MKVSAEAFSLAGDEFLGRSYQEMDCQEFVERSMRKVGINLDLAGSNAWYRQMTWTGSPEECKKKFGSIPKGALLYILKQNGSEPEKYKADGKGNASHIGIFTGRSSNDMLAYPLSLIHGANDEETKKLRDDFRKKVSFGDGAIHSSSSRGCVATSKFEGKAISGGWNRVGLWDRFTYGNSIDALLSGQETPKNDNEKEIEVVIMRAVVKSQNGKGVNFRSQKSTSSTCIETIPEGTEVDVTADDGTWSSIIYKGRSGYAMSAYLEPVNGSTISFTVDRSTAETFYAALGEALNGGGAVG